MKLVPSALPSLLAFCTCLPAQETSWLDRWHAIASIEANTGYYFRGLAQQKRIPILHGSLELGYDLLTRRGITVQPFAGVWNSFSTQRLPTAQTGGTWDPWYELDLYGGVQVSGPEFLARATFTTYGSPARAFGEFDDVTVSLGWTPRDVPLATALAPSLTYAQETRGSADGLGRGSYLEVGVQPTFELGQLARRPMRLTVPLAAGFSLGRYYESPRDGSDERFGFFDAGLELAVDLYRVAKRGLSTLTLGVHRLELGDHAADFNGGDRGEWLASCSLTLKF